MKESTAELLKRLDLQRVQEEIRAVEGVPAWENAGITARVLAAADLWLIDDLRTATGGMYTEIKGECRESKGILDLIIVGEDSYHIIDWKTTTDVGRPHYKDELVNDVQTGLYLAYAGEWLSGALGGNTESGGEAGPIDPKAHLGSGAKPRWVWGVGGGAPASGTPYPNPTHIEYRCLGLDVHDKISTRVFRVDYDKKIVNRAKQQLALIQTQTAQLIVAESSPWPQRKPKACFGTNPCAFTKECFSFTEPEAIGIASDKHALLIPKSKSSLKLFQDCPEKFRREKLCGEEAGQSQAMLVGIACHAGIAEIWKQAYELLRSEF